MPLCVCAYSQVDARKRADAAAAALLERFRRFSLRRLQDMRRARGSSAVGSVFASRVLHRRV